MLRFQRLYPGPVFSDPTVPGGPATIVGPPPEWNDSDDATYAISDTDASGSSSFRAPLADLDLLDPTVAQMSSVQVYVRYSTSYPDGFGTWGSFVLPRQARFVIYEPDGAIYSDVFNKTLDPPDDDGIHVFNETVWPILDDPDYSTFVGGELLRVFKAGSLFSVRTEVPTLPYSFAQSAITTYEAWIEVNWETTEAPVVRQLGRRDGLGQASVGRLAPGTRSVSRVVGGQP